MTATVPTQLPPFAELLTWARDWARMTPAEFDHGLVFPDPDGEGPGGSWDAYSTAVYHLVQHPDGADAPIHELIEPARQVREHYRPELDEHIAAAKARGFLGWSNAARARGQSVRYADA